MEENKGEKEMGERGKKKKERWATLQESGVLAVGRNGKRGLFKNRAI